MRLVTCVDGDIRAPQEGGGTELPLELVSSSGVKLLLRADEAQPPAAPPPPSRAVPPREQAEAIQAVRELPTREPYLGPGQGAIRVIGGWVCSRQGRRVIQAVGNEVGGGLGPRDRWVGVQRIQLAVQSGCEARGRVGGGQGGTFPLARLSLQ